MLHEWTAKVAVYWDFENIHASLYDKKYGQGTYGNSPFEQQEQLIQVHGVMGYARSLGEIAINRAYADWSFLLPYKQQVLSNCVELIQLFHPGPKAKNGADIRIVLDAMLDTQHYPHISHVVVVGGDSDYIGLVQKLRNSSVYVIGIGVEGGTNRHWVSSCDEFRHYGEIVGPTTSPTSSAKPCRNEGGHPRAA